MSTAVLGLVMTGRAESAVKVNWRVEVDVNCVSFTINVTPKLPAVVGVPEMSPVIPGTSLRINPGGSPVAVSVAAGLPPLVKTRKRNGCPTLPVAAGLLIITGPAGGNWTTLRLRTAFAVIRRRFRLPSDDALPLDT